jgi:hypothetical protein
MSCLASSNVSYISNNSATGYVQFSLGDTNEKITAINIVWMSGTANQIVPIVFGETITIGTVSGTSSVITATNGGFTVTGTIVTSGETNCPGEDIALPSDAVVQSVMIPRLIWNQTAGNFVAQTTYSEFYARLNNNSSTGYTVSYGAGSNNFIGQIILTIENVGTPCTKATASFAEETVSKYARTS